MVHLSPSSFLFPFGGKLSTLRLRVRSEGWGALNLSSSDKCLALAICHYGSTGLRATASTATRALIHNDSCATQRYYMPRGQLVITQCKSGVR